MTTFICPDYSKEPSIFGVKRVGLVWEATAFGPYGREKFEGLSRRSVIRKARKYLRRVYDQGETIEVNNGHTSDH